MDNQNDGDIVEAFLRSTIDPAERDLHEELTSLMNGKRPDGDTEAVAFALYATARSALKGMLRQNKSITIIDSNTGETKETESIPQEIEGVMRSAAMMLALGRDERNFSPMHYVGLLLDMICVCDDGDIGSAPQEVVKAIDSHTLAAIDSIRKGKHIVSDN